jgi:2',3'-cyclic-nucleotide 2'-phosphodiesterase / 3'-nucleotidase / 5'-nucleotidase
MKIGWVKVNSKWYYLQKDGAMFDVGTNGWLKINGKWYFLYWNGEMAADTTIGKCKIGKDGAWIK